MRPPDDCLAFNLPPRPSRIDCPTVWSGMSSVASVQNKRLCMDECVALTLVDSLLEQSCTESWPSVDSPIRVWSMEGILAACLHQVRALCVQVGIRLKCLFLLYVTPIYAVTADTSSRSWSSQNSYWPDSYLACTSCVNASSSPNIHGHVAGCSTLLAAWNGFYVSTTPTARYI